MESPVIVNSNFHNNSHNEQSLVGKSPAQILGFELPVYKDEEDICAFFTKYEKSAEILQIPPRCYSAHLENVLTGRALYYYNNLPHHVKENYNLSKIWLMHITQNYSVPSAETCRLKFKNAKPSPATVKFNSHLCYIYRNFLLWLEFNSVPKTFEDLKYFIILDQFISSLPENIENLVRGRNPKTLKEAVKLANSFARTINKKKPLTLSLEPLVGYRKNYLPVCHSRSGLLVAKTNSRICKSRSRLGLVSQRCKVSASGGCSTEISRRSCYRLRSGRSSKNIRSRFFLYSKNSNKDSPTETNPPSLLNRRPSGSRGRSSNLSLLASRFEATPPVFQKVGNFISSTQTRTAALQSSRRTVDANPFFRGAASPKSELTTVKLKRVSKFDSKDKAGSEESTVERTQTDHAENSLKTNFKAKQSVLIDRCKGVISKSRDTSTTRVTSNKDDTTNVTVETTSYTSSSSISDDSLKSAEVNGTEISEPSPDAASSSNALSRCVTIKVSDIPTISETNVSVSPTVSKKHKKTTEVTSKKISDSTVKKSANSTDKKSTESSIKKKKIKENIVIPESVEIINNSTEGRTSVEKTKENLATNYNIDKQTREIAIDTETVKTKPKVRTIPVDISQLTKENKLKQKKEEKGDLKEKVTNKNSNIKVEDNSKIDGELSPSKEPKTISINIKRKSPSPLKKEKSLDKTISNKEITAAKEVTIKPNDSKVENDTKDDETTQIITSSVKIAPQESKMDTTSISDKVSDIEMESLNREKSSPPVSSLTTSSSVSSLTTSSDTISTSLSDLSCSPPSTTSSVVSSNLCSASTSTTISTVGTVSTPVSTTVESQSTASACALPTVDPSPNFMIILRDFSSLSATSSRTTLYMSKGDTVGHLLSKVSSLVHYVIGTFSLAYNLSLPEPHEVELHSLPPEMSLLDAGLMIDDGNDGTVRNSVMVTDLGSACPVRLHEETAATPEGVSSKASGCSFFVPTSSSSSSSASKYSEDTTSVKDNSRLLHYGAGNNQSYKCKTNYVGLVNQAMTCYLNSLLQTLYMTPEFRNALYRWEFKGTPSEGEKSIPFQLQRLFLLLQTTDRSAVETTKLTKSFGWDSSEAWQQHDIQELCRVMFDALEQSFSKTDQANLIDRLYQGNMKDYVKCLSCSKENARMDSFLDIPLPIRPFGSSTAYRSLEEALGAFVAPEVLDGNNQYQCDNCNTKRDAHKGLKFTKYPYLLTIHLKRFDFDYQTFHRIKLNDRVTFPDHLDLSDFLDESTDDEEATKAESAPNHFDDAATDDSGSALDNDDSSLNDLTPPQHSNQDDDEGIDLNNSDSDRNSAATTKKKEYDFFYTKQTKNSSPLKINKNLENGPVKIETNVTNVTNKEDAGSSSSSGKTFQLFSIMIHSGSATGGHYYAYIKDLATSNWFCFNDQTVSKISDEDIRRTYGSGSSGSNRWSGSANAYMLMYRQCDDKLNVLPFTDATFPKHIKELRTRLTHEEESEKQARELERVTVPVQLFCNHPLTAHLTDTRLRVLKEDTLSQATKQAYDKLELKNVVPIERCRLVKYNELDKSIEKSFEKMDNTPVGELLHDVKNSQQTVDLLMEIREEGAHFEAYEAGGFTLKVHIVHLEGDVEGPLSMRGNQSMTVSEFKSLFGAKHGLNPTNMRVVVENMWQDMKLLENPSEVLKTEVASYRIFVEASGNESTDQYKNSQMESVISMYHNTIKLSCSVPKITAEMLKELNIPPYLGSESKSEADESVSSCPPLADKGSIPPSSSPIETLTSFTTSFVDSSTSDDERLPLSNQSNPAEVPTTYTATVTTVNNLSNPSKMNLTLPVPSLNVPQSNPRKGTPTPQKEGKSTPTPQKEGIDFQGNSPNLSDGEDEATNSWHNSSATDQSTSEDSSLTSDSDRTLVGDPPEDMDDRLSDRQSPDYHNVSSPEDNNDAVSSPVTSKWLSTPNTADYFVDRRKEDDSEDLGVADIWAVNDADDFPSKRYFKCSVVPSDPANEEMTLALRVDKRMTIDELKQSLQPIIHVKSDHFKLYKKYIKEYECTISDSVKNLGEDCKLSVKLDRALLEGEFKGKIHLLTVDNLDEPSKFLSEWVLRNGQTVGEAKKEMIEHVRKEFGLQYDLDNLRLRKKCWKNPQTVYLDHQVFGEDISLYKHWELFVSFRKVPELKTGATVDEVLLFVRKWSPSEYKVHPIEEILLPEPSAECLRQRLSLLSEIPEEDIEFAKGKGAFPCDMSVLTVNTELSWEYKGGSLEDDPYRILDDGALLYFRDKKEMLKPLSDNEKNQLESDEYKRLNKEEVSSYTPVAPKPAKEKGLKIYY